MQRPSSRMTAPLFRIHATNECLPDTKAAKAEREREVGAEGAEDTGASVSNQHGMHARRRAAAGTGAVMRAHRNAHSKGTGLDRAAANA
jgi:hypothetical protein